MKTVSYEKVKLQNTVVALGKFEGMHKGHMLLLDEVIHIAAEKKLTSVVLTVNVPSDKVINTASEQHDILRKQNIDMVVPCMFTKAFASLLPEEFVKQILVDGLGAKYVVVGEDFHYGHKRLGNCDTLKHDGAVYGFQLVSFPKLSLDGKVVSSSYIRELIERGKMDEVYMYMGRYYKLTGTVVHGKMLGRTIGFPTVNIIPATEKLLPPSGVYASELECCGKCYKAVTNIGSNPTVTEDETVKIETHILDYNGDLYGREVQVSLKRFIRHETRFNSMEELKMQLEKDKLYVMQM
ncbi:MAG: bifunctional riboflavin kinase/FAD synthetase [Clostridium sp.]|nr:bifunctional riboflavin kinase/FAD synthetase [Clostridium sp.]MCM1397956.1 bifunctional riboflavin kinase/FAD synthetase [Clostridium sp.]MCM1459407.1 bifunctional riboflavin kinase/FAD synthetase [Bacteroides sp.]